METQRRIWWIASYPKSGNTWVRMLWAAYRKGELGLNDFYGYSSGDLNSLFYQMVSCEPLTSLEPHEFVAIRPAALFTMCKTFALDPLLLKTHAANVALDQERLIPVSLTAGAVYVVRDPRDVALSWARHNGFDVDRAIEKMEKDDAVIGKTEDRMWHFLSDWSTHVKSWLDEKRFPVKYVKYENMLTSPAEKFAGILRHWGIEPDVDKIARAVELTDFSRLQKLEAVEKFLEAEKGKFFGYGQAGRWEKYLSWEQIERIEEKHGAVMERLGYRLLTREAAA